MKKRSFVIRCETRVEKDLKGVTGWTLETDWDHDRLDVLLYDKDIPDEVWKAWDEAVIPTDDLGEMEEAEEERDKAFFGYFGIDPNLIFDWEFID